MDAWIGAIAYTLQIYFDFSAYSDMAIGLAAMAGFKFHENFKTPYLSHSIQDFWRRWHMSLSFWLRDYVYIPLGGSRVRVSRVYFNLIFVFFLCGLWHGANTTFVVWGLYNGFFLVLERLFLKDLLQKVPVFIRRFYIIVVVIVGWVIFRAESMDEAYNYLASMFSLSNLLSMPTQSIALFESINLVGFIAGILICQMPLKSFDMGSSYEHSRVNYKAIYPISVLLFVISVVVLYMGARNPFIYFNF